MGGCVGKTTELSTCVRCGVSLPSAKMSAHECPVPKPIVRPKPQTFTPYPQLVSLTHKVVPDTNQKLRVKIPRDKTRTRYIWKYQQALFYPAEIRSIPREYIRHASFQEKLNWFRLNLESRRISWQKGSDVLKVDRWNILFSSLEGLKSINFYKELKIQFTDQKVDDAGGLLREWMHLCIKEIMSKEAGIFKQCQTEETAYKFIWDRNTIEQVDLIAIKSLNLLGLIIGKALFQRISLNCYLDRTILRQICSQPIHIEDVYSYDKALYQSWSSVLTMQNAEQLHLDGCLYHTHGEKDLQQIELFPNGKNIMINNSNRDIYITEMIHQYCTKGIAKYLKALLTSIYKIIPPDLLSVFEPHELEMILNGPITIDIKDWKNHAVYEACTEKDQLIKWFWETVQSYDQEGLKNLLHYCTGSVRVPILGFKYLESNRGEVRQFTIRKVPYEKGNPFPKSHTCFNRLQIPAYTTKQELQDRLRIIMAEQLNHFGLS